MRRERLPLSAAFLYYKPDVNIKFKEFVMSSLIISVPKSDEQLAVDAFKKSMENLDLSADTLVEPYETDSFDQDALVEWLFTVKKSTIQLIKDFLDRYQGREVVIIIDGNTLKVKNGDVKDATALLDKFSEVLKNKK